MEDDKGLGRAGKMLKTEEALLVLSGPGTLGNQKKRRLAELLNAMDAQIAVLQAENGSKDKGIERLNKMLADSFQGHLLGELQRKDDALSRVEAERDAAVKDLCLAQVARRARGGVSMDRLTYKDEFGRWTADVHYGGAVEHLRDVPIDRLAAYEDTGLEPEDFKRMFNEEAVVKLAAQALGTTPDRLRELVKAQEDGQDG